MENKSESNRGSISSNAGMSNMTSNANDATSEETKQLNARSAAKKGNTKKEF